MLVQFAVRGDPRRRRTIEPILDAVAGVQRANSTSRIREVGPASANYELGKTFDKDFANAEKLTIPITLVILLAAFGALVAAGLPVLLAFSAVLASLGLFALISHVYRGLPVHLGRDPAHRDGRRRRLLALLPAPRARGAREGAEPRHALLRAAATSGQAVLVSGATVLIAMAGMFIAGNRIFTGMAIGTMLVVLSTLIGSLTVLPAALSKLGDRVDRLRMPFVGKSKHAAGESRFWAFVLDRVLRRPVLSILARRRAPARGGGTAAQDAHEAAELHRHAPGAPDREDLHGRRRRVPGRAHPGRGGRPGPHVRSRAVGPDRTRRRGGRDRTDVPADPVLSPDDTVADIRIPIAGNGDDAASLAALRTLRTEVSRGRRRARRRVRRRRRDRRHPRLQRADEGADAVRDPVRAGARLPPAAATFRSS